MNFEKINNNILTSKQKYFVLCSSTVKEPVSSDSRVYPIHSITHIYYKLISLHFPQCCDVVCWMDMWYCVWSGKID